MIRRIPGRMARIRLGGPMKQSAVAVWTILGILVGAIVSPGAFASEGIFRAGAAEADITPRVAEFEDGNANGTFDRGDPNKAYGFGDRVIRFERPFWPDRSS